MLTRWKDVEDVTRDVPGELACITDMVGWCNQHAPKPKRHQLPLAAFETYNTAQLQKVEDVLPSQVAEGTFEPIKRQHLNKKVHSNVDVS